MADSTEELKKLAELLGSYSSEIDRTFEKYGQLSGKRIQQIEDQAKAEELALTAVKKSITGFDKLTKAQQDAALEQIKQTASVNKITDSLNKQTEAINVYTREENKAIEAAQKALKQKQAEADSTKHQGSQVNDAFSKISSSGGLLSMAQGAATEKIGATAAGAAGVTVAFELLKFGIELGTLSFNQWVASLDQAFESQLRYNTAVALGADGMQKANMQAIEKMRFDSQQAKEQSALFKNLATSMIPLGIGFVGLGVKAAITGTAIMGITGPIGILLGVLAGFIAWWGATKAIEKRAEAQADEAAAVRLENQSKLQEMLYKSFNDLGDASMTGAGGMTELAQNAHKAGFAIKDLDKFTGILKNSAGDISMFGVTAVDGAKNFAEVTGKMTDEFGMHFRNLGISAEAQAASVEKYMALQAKLGLLQGKTQAEQAAGAAKYLEELDKTATLLGQSRKEQEDSRAAIMAIEQGQAALMDAEARGDTNRVKELERAIMASSSLQKTDPKVAAGLMKLVSSQGAVSDDDTRRALQSIPQTLEAVRRGTGTEFSRNRGAMSELGGTYQRTAGNFAATGTDMGLTGGFYGAMLKQEARMAEAIKEAAKQGLKPGTPEFEKFVEDLATRKEAKDPETEAYNKMMIKQQKDSIAMDEKLLSGINDFTADVKTFGEAVDKFLGKDKSTGFAPTPVAGPTTGVGPEGGSKPAGGAGGSTPAGPGTSSGLTGNAQLKAAGLKIKEGDVQAPGAHVDPKLIEIAKQAQASIPGFNYFSSFNDNYHNEKSKGSQHTKGLAFDFTVNPGEGKSKPSKEDSEKIMSMLQGMGLSNILNEYDNPSEKATGGHFHAELKMPGAFDGGLFDGPKAGYPVELHGREAIVPMPDPSSKIKIETNSPDKEPLSSVVNNSSNSTFNTTDMMSDIFAMMSSKMDDMISALDKGNSYSDKLVKAMA